MNTSNSKVAAPGILERLGALRATWSSQPGPAGADAGDAAARLLASYEATGRQLRGWLRAGLGLLLAGLGLFMWGPRDRRAEPRPTQGYTFRQAGTVRRADTTWAWILADTAGRARVLLSPDQGHTWRVRDLGLPASRARALALGWGTPGRGLVVGDSGRARVLADVFRAPRQGRASRLSTDPRQGLFSVAVDSAGQQAVVLGRQVAVQATKDGGRSWPELGAAKFRAPSSPKPILAVTVLDAFVLVAADTLYSLILTPSQQEAQNPHIVLREGIGWTCLHNPFTITPVALSFDPQGKALAVAADGTAQRFYLGGARHTDWQTGRVSTVRLFESQPPAQAVLVEEVGGLDSTLLFSNTAQSGGQQRRAAIAPSLATLDAVQAIRDARVPAQPTASAIRPLATASSSARKTTRAVSRQPARVQPLAASQPAAKQPTTAATVASPPAKQPTTSSATNSPVQSVPRDTGTSSSPQVQQRPTYIPGQKPRPLTTD